MGGLAPRWREALSLERRGIPEFYASIAEVDGGAHAEAMRMALGDLGLSGVYCIGGVPTVGFLEDSAVSSARIDELHRVLWNQGLMSLLLVIKGDELCAYSLVQRPFERLEGLRSDPRLITTLSLLSDALKLRELLDSTESGRFWFENDSYFNPEERVDSVLLSNLLEAFRAMRDELGGEAAQALLMQTMFIAYLEDRGIIKEAVFRQASENACSSLSEMLEAENPAHFETLFRWLKEAFNGNLFNAPCGFEKTDTVPSGVTVRHLRTLARFRHGREEMVSGQFRLWGYDFRYMSIGLISAVYDRFLKEEAARRNAEGAFYTPMFLADVVVNQLWDELSDNQRSNGTFCDPACGSGIFLVRLFQRLVADHCRIKNKKKATWDELKAIARRLHGADINPSAVRVAAFSLYIALLEQANPPDLPALIKAGKLLPSLYRDTLLPSCDFLLANDNPCYDAIIGNPPWKGRSGQVTTAQTWAKTEGYPVPAKDIAWGFIWKALRVVKPDGVIAFLLPAMGVLHNTSGESLDARRQLLRKSRVKRIINLSDLCFQLFDGAQRPTALVLYQPAKQGQLAYRFDYWVPKADLNLRLKRLMTLSRADRISLRADLVGDDPTLFKRRLWTRAPEERLLQFLRTIPPLSRLVFEYKSVQRRTIDRKTDWVIGQGFKPAQSDRLEDDGYDVSTSEQVTHYPYLNASAFRAIAMPLIDEPPWHTPTVHRTGFADGFVEPHILIPQGVERSSGRVRAAYCEQSLVFQHSIQAIIVPPDERRRAKILTAVLNSSLAAWFYFHDTANLGTDRAKVHQGELLKLPFDSPENMPDAERAKLAEDKIVRLIDCEIAKAQDLLSHQGDPLREIDKLVFDYYGLDEFDITLVEDTYRYIIPAMQPRRNAGLQQIWANSLPQHRSDYASTLCRALSPCFRQTVNSSLVAHSRDVAILKLTISPLPEAYREESSLDLERFLQAVASDLPVRLPGNVQLVPDLRFVIGSDMYLVKPMQLRYWLRSTALADAEQIAAEFAAVVARHNRDNSTYVGG